MSGKGERSSDEVSHRPHDVVGTRLVHGGRGGDAAVGANRLLIAQLLSTAPCVITEAPRATDDVGYGQSALK
jgi:hypothetical protein